MDFKENVFQTKRIASFVRRKYCMIRSCTNGAGTAVKLFQVPSANPHRQQWIDAISPVQKFDRFCLAFRICSLHFDDDCFRNNDLNKLKPGSVPTLFHLTSVERPEHVQILEEPTVLTRIEQVVIKNEEDNKNDIVILDVESNNGASSDCQICFICNGSSKFYRQNLYETKSKYTDTRIYDFIKKWLGDSSPSREIDADDNCVCNDCLDKINEYDLMCVQAERINKELSDTFLLTELMAKASNPQKKVKANGPNAVRKQSSGKSLVLDPFTGEFVESSEIIDTAENDTIENEDNFNDEPCGSKDEPNVKRIRYVYYCTMCDTVLTSPESLKKHEHSSANFKMVTQINGKIIFSDDDDDDDEKSKGKTSKGKGKYKRKSDNKVNKPKTPKPIYECPKCPMELYKGEDSECEADHVLSHTTPIDPLRCPKCGFKLDDEQSLNEHIELHKNVEQFQCVFCSKTSKSNNLLRIHMRMVHIPNSYVNVCEHCGKMFTSQSTFADHKLEHKVNKSNAVCKVCGKSFGKRKTLGKHMKIHSDVKKPCPVCGKRFSYNNNLRAHLRTHDRTLPSADKFYSHICPVCSKSFPRPHLLRKHMAKEHEVMEFRQPMHPMA